jgi:hypothetical protein
MQSLRSWINGSKPNAKPAHRSAAGQSAWLEQRASLEGLEVRDSTWDEWMACSEARSTAPSGQLAPRASAQ